MTRSRAEAETVRRAFAAIKRRILKRVGRELITKDLAIGKLRRTFLKMQAVYLRLDFTTYSDWLEATQPEWDEVLAAAADDAILDHLVDRCSEAAS